MGKHMEMLEGTRKRRRGKKVPQATLPIPDDIPHFLGCVTCYIRFQNAVTRCTIDPSATIKEFNDFISHFQHCPSHNALTINEDSGSETSSTVELEEVE